MQLLTRLSKGVIVAGFLLFAVHAAHAPIQPGAVWGTVASPVSVLFAGDIMLDRNVAKWREADPAPMFEGVKEHFDAADIRVANLEGTVTDNPSIARKNSSILRFTFAPAFAEAALAPLKLTAVSLANNHALDFGEFGYDDTTTWLSGQGIKYFGQPNDDRDKISTTLETLLGTLCLLGYHGVWNTDPARVLAEIERVRPACWRAVVFAHWGDEYQPVPEQDTVAIARSFIDAGADVVIGAHPHVVQPQEVYKGRAIFYSLGNFMFDQEFSPEVMRGLMVRAEFGPAKTCFTPIPVAIEHAAVRALPALDSFCLP